MPIIEPLGVVPDDHIHVPNKPVPIPAERQMSNSARGHPARNGAHRLKPIRLEVESGAQHRQGAVANNALEESFITTPDYAPQRA